MFVPRKRFTALALAIATAIPVISAAPSHAETFVFASGPLTNLNPAGATINGGFTKFPTGSGMYIQQCIAPVGTARPVTCSDTLQLWVTTTGEPGSSISTGPIAMKVAGTIMGRGVSVDCTSTECGLFFRRDRTAGADTSEDKFLPITFTKGFNGPILAADEVTVTLNGKALVRNVPSNLAYRANAKIVATAKSGLAVTLTSLTPDCSISNGVFVALKGAGQCALAFATAGNDTVAAAGGNFPFLLVPGEQKIERMTKSLVKSKPKALPTETNFGAGVTYKSLTKNCVVELNLVQGNKGGNCKIRATAPEKSGMWNALSVIYTIPVK
jgi:hypothetical protein